MLHEEVIWAEKYRPRTVEETILPFELKIMFQSFITKGYIPNLLLVGGPGMGKTTVAKAMCEELNSDYFVINGSLQGNIDTLRNEILDFASTCSLTGNRKYVILDEADYINPQHTQPALRNFMEEYSSNCGFILTANYPNKIIPALHSRDGTIEFKIPKNERAKIAAAFFKRVLEILDTEKISHNKAVVAEVINKHFPDFRKVLNELQKYSALGEIDTGILANVNIDELVKFIKEKNYTATRKWVAENLDYNATDLFRKFYDTSVKYLKPHSMPALVLLIGKYQYQDNFVSDKEINIMAFIAELMLEEIYE